MYSDYLISSLVILTVCIGALKSIFSKGRTLIYKSSISNI